MVDIADPTVQFTITIVVAIITLIVGIIAYIKRNNTKALTFRTVNVIGLLSYSDQVKDKLRITYDGVTVEDLTVALFQFTNSGNATIEPSDFKKPLSFVFSNDVKVLAADLTEKTPEGLELTIKVQDNVVSINPEFLNVKDTFTVRLLTNKFFEDKDYRLDYRIIGVNKIKEKIPRMDFGTSLILSMLVTLILMLSGTYASSVTHNNNFINIALLGVFGLVGIMGYIIISTLLDYVEQYRERKTNTKIFK
jgi:hypothetical protein